MVSRCHECVHSIEEQKNFLSCQIKETIENSPITFFDGCPFFEQKYLDLDIDLTKLNLKNLIKNE